MEQAGEDWGLADVSPQASEWGLTSSLPSHRGEHAVKEVAPVRLVALPASSVCGLSVCLPSFHRTAEDAQQFRTLPALSPA